MKPLAICAVFKNEAPFLLEWIAYHRAIGFDHFVLYDNGSTDGGVELIGSSWAADCTTLRLWPERPAQLAAYRHFVYNLAEFFEWVAFIDLDEFLLPLHETSLAAMLRSCNDFSAILVNWRCFGPSGWGEPPDGLVIDNYIWRSGDEFPANRHVKSIVKCADLLDITQNPHDFQLKGPVCDTAGRGIGNTAIVPLACHENLVLNHYVTRSRRDWTNKIQRGSATSADSELAYEESRFNHWAEVSYVEDQGIVKWAPNVRALLAAGAADTVGHRPRPSSRLDPTPSSATALPPPRLVPMIVHIQGVGDVEGRLGDWIGKRGGGRWIEGFRIATVEGAAPGEIQYQVVLGTGLVSGWTDSALFCGSWGLGIPIWGFAIRLSGGTADRYESTCYGSFVGRSDVKVAGSSCLCAAPAPAPLEALRIVLRPRKSATPRRSSQ